MTGCDYKGNSGEDWRPTWLERERATVRLIERCFKLFTDGPETPPAQRHALCKLTLITKRSGSVADPALEVLPNEELTACAQERRE